MSEDEESEFNRFWVVVENPIARVAGRGKDGGADIGSVHVVVVVIKVLK
jgi:hypothetical protein